MTYEERQAWLQARRELRERDRRNRGDDRDRDTSRKGNKSRDKALSAQEDTIRALKAQLQMQEKQIKDATDQGHGTSNSNRDFCF